jgi:hypothetical protein
MSRTLTILNCISWIATVALALLMRLALLHSVALLRRVNELNPTKGPDHIAPDKTLRFSGRSLFTESVVTEADLLGHPSTILFLRPDSKGDDRAALRLLAMAHVAWRRSFGRMWILCQGTHGACSHLLKTLQQLSALRAEMIYDLEGNADWICSTIPTGDVIMHVDSRGQVVTYGYQPTLDQNSLNREGLSA